MIPETIVMQHPRDAIRPTPERPTGAEPAAAAPDKRETPGGPPAVPVWNWRLVVFLWITSMLFLGLYEFLSAFLRMVFFPSSP